MNLDLLGVTLSPGTVALGKGWTTTPCPEHGKELANAEEARLRKMLQYNGIKPQQKYQTRMNHKVTKSLPASIQKGKTCKQPFAPDSRLEVHRVK